MPDTTISSFVLRYIRARNGIPTSGMDFNTTARLRISQLRIPDNARFVLEFLDPDYYEDRIT